jgi:hypothetical protein
MFTGRVTDLGLLWVCGSAGRCESGWQASAGHGGFNAKAASTRILRTRAG